MVDGLAQAQLVPVVQQVPRGANTRYDPETLARFAGAYSALRASIILP
jgi:hypothetical protein